MSSSYGLTLDRSYDIISPLRQDLRTTFLCEGRNEVVVNLSYPLKFKPIAKELIWGGDMLKRFVKEGHTNPIGELWYTSDFKDDISVVSNGEARGYTLRKLMEEFPYELTGITDKLPRFPILVKFIESKKYLSVQVHPDDDMAKKYEKEPWGKTEMWYFIDTKEGFDIVAGLKEGVKKEDLKQHMGKSSIRNFLRHISPKKGCSIYIPAGLVHALGNGGIVAEIQQTSDTTYRLYDWDRLGMDGKPRELHLEKGFRAIKVDLRPDLVCKEEGSLVESPYFNVTKLRLEGSKEFEKNARFLIIVSIGKEGGEIEGNGVKVTFYPLDVILIPAVLQRFTISSKKGEFLFVSN